VLARVDVDGIRLGVWAWSLSYDTGKFTGNFFMFYKKCILLELSHLGFRVQWISISYIKRLVA
jgi:hypothetical protein